MPLNTLLTGYLALGTAFLSSSNTLTELNASGYARVAMPVNYDTAANQIQLPQGVTFSATGAWSAVTYAAIFDAAVGGNCLLAWQVPSFTLSSGASQSYSAHTFDMAVKAPLAAGASVVQGTVVATLLNAQNNVLASNAVNSVPITYNTATGTMGASSASYSPLAQAPVVFRDILDGGDMTVNPFQRNIPGLASGGVCSTTASSTPVYFADRWAAVGGASSSITQALVANVTYTGYSQALQWGRTAANTNTAAIYLGHVVETADAIRNQGQQMTLSFIGALGANYSGGQVTAQVIVGTGTNQSFANLVAGSWTGQTVAFTQNFTMTTSMARYQVSGAIPANATQIGVLFSYTPSGTAGTNDNIQWLDFDLAAGAPASPPERRDIQVELEICQRYAWIQAEPAANVILASGSTITANNQTFVMGTPVQMRAAPTVTVATGSFKVASGAAPASATITAGTTHTPNQISVNSTLTATAGFGALLEGGGGSGYIVASSDF